MNEFREKFPDWVSWLMPLALCVSFAVGGGAWWWSEMRRLRSEALAMERSVSLSSEYERQWRRFRSMEDSLHHCMIRMAPPVESFPVLDSLRRMAQNAGLRVWDVRSVAGDQGEFAEYYRMDLTGTYEAMILWMDTLEKYHPHVQVLSFRLTADEFGQMRLSGLEIGAGLSLVQKLSVKDELLDSAAQFWLSRCARLGDSTLSRRSTNNPFAMRKIPEKKKVPAPVAPVLRVSGVVSGRVATVLLESGEKRLVRPGDSLEGWNVLKVTDAGVFLERDGWVREYSLR